MPRSETLAHYSRTRRRALVVGLALGGALLVIMVGAVALGAMSIPYRDVVQIILGKTLARPAWLDGFKPNAIAVVWELRLPRIICGLFVGAGLAGAGVIFQAILVNPLADPYTLGVSSGAAFGASLAIVGNLLLGWTLPVPILALAFALLTLLLVILISQRGGGFLRSNLIIAGIIMSSILSAGISFMKILAGDDVAAIVFWLMGSLSARDWADAGLVAVAVTACLALAFAFANDLNVMTLGSRTAASLGVNVGRTRLFYLVLGSTVTAICVSVCGVIGFVGLIVPHLLRTAVASDNRLLLVLSALLGAVLLTTADAATRLISSGEIPVGVLTTLLGGPFFIYVFLRRKGVAHYE